MRSLFTLCEGNGCFSPSGGSVADISKVNS